ncbi:hypothetical protein ACE05D_18950, partial [Marinobacter shengliensis]
LWWKLYPEFRPTYCLDSGFYFCRVDSLGKDSGFVKDARGQDLRLGLSMCRLKDGRMQRDWFSG